MSPTYPGAGAAPGVSAFGSAVNENTRLVDGTGFTGAYGGGVVPWIDTDVSTNTRRSLTQSLWRILMLQGCTSFKLEVL